MKTSEIFLQKIKKKINNGEYKDYMDLPFMSNEKLYNAIEKNIKEKDLHNQTPILSEKEIIEMIKDMREAAGSAFYLFLKHGFLEPTDNGYQLSQKGQLAIKQSQKDKK